MVSCDDSRVLFLLHDRSLLGVSPNLSALHKGCADINASHALISDPTASVAGTFSGNDTGSDFAHQLGRSIYAYATPIIILVGLVGNVISVKVFTSKVMSRLSSSAYLIALSVSDICVLLTYVLFVWLNKGLPTWPGGRRFHVTNTNGACHFFLYVSYVSRFVSVWLLVLFTFERHIAVCWPAKRKIFCTKSCARRLIAAVLIIASVICIYKPLLSGVYAMDVLPETVCTRNPARGRLTFVLDAAYGLIITAVPFVVVTLLSVPILRKFISWNRQKNDPKLVFRENRIRLEFTFFLLVVSSCFVGLSIPYFVLWCQQFTQSLQARPDAFAASTSEQLFITRTVFYLNYCVKFFLYCLTGAYYRREIRSIFRYYFTSTTSASVSTRRDSGLRIAHEAHPMHMQRTQRTQQTRCAV